MQITFGEHSPEIDPTAYLAPGAVVTGRVRMAAESSLWFGCVARGDGDVISIGRGSNVQDGSVLHADPDFPVTIGDGVVVGHRAVIHGCTIDDSVLVGMGAVVMNGARIGTGSVIGAGAVISPGTQVPPGSLVVGVPGKVARETSADERAHIPRNAAHYVALAAAYRDGPPPTG